MKTKEEILLREHFEVETDAGKTLRTFDYIDALEKHASYLSERVKELEEEIEWLKRKKQRVFDLFSGNRKHLKARIKELESESAEDDHVMLILQDQCKIKDDRIKELESQQQPVKEVQSKYPNLEKGGHCEGTAP